MTCPREIECGQARPDRAFPAKVESGFASGNALNFQSGAISYRFGDFTKAESALPRRLRHFIPFHNQA